MNAIEDVIKSISQLKKRGINRGIIKKGISEEDVLESVGKIAEQGIKQVKLYFMIGLPTETDEDIDEIIKLTLKCKEILDRQRTGGRITLNIAPFVPKAGTPFQCLPMAQPFIMNHRLSLLKRSLPPKGITLKGESIAWSQIQVVLARGDTKLAEVLDNIEEVSLSGWRRAVEKNHLDIDFYVNQRWDINQKLPWGIIDLGTKEGQLELELDRAMA